MVHQGPVSIAVTPQYIHFLSHTSVAAFSYHTRTNVQAHPPEPDVRGDIVSQMREASMSKDKMKLEAAIKKAEEAGLHFEANQGRRQLSRITG